MVEDMAARAAMEVVMAARAAMEEALEATVVVMEVGLADMVEVQFLFYTLDCKRL